MTFCQLFGDTNLSCLSYEKESTGSCDTSPGISGMAVSRGSPRSGDLFLGLLASFSSVLMSLSNRFSPCAALPDRFQVPFRPLSNVSGKEAPRSCTVSQKRPRE